MIECPNCGGNLKFDIRSQQLACAFCNTLMDPYAVTKDKDAEEQTDYEVTVFTCPQCNGEIYSTDTTAAGFCSFCGASTILSSRLEREHKPKAIIPFLKTKEDCKSEYIKRVRKAVFAPKELRNPKYIESFRGIYMPYWVYHVTQQGPLLLLGKTTHRSGDYEITDHYNLTGNLDMDYYGLSYDASTSFADNISDRIAPFDAKRMKEFTPSFLSGFYADMADVGEDVYVQDAVNAADNQTTGYLDEEMDFSHYNPSYENATNKYHTLCGGADLAMFPVWFMSYRNKDRVAYATVNGQTGKVVADLPVQISKYMLASLALMVPIFFLLNLFLTITPSVLLAVISIIATVVLIIYEKEIKEIAVKEGYEDDKGAQEGVRQKQMKKRAAMETAAGLEGMTGRTPEESIEGMTGKTPEENLNDMMDVEPFVVTKEQLRRQEKTQNVREKKEKPKKATKDKKLKLAEWFLFAGVFLYLVPDFLEMFVSAGTAFRMGAVIGALVLSGYMTYKGQTYWKETSLQKSCPGFLWTMLAQVAAALIVVLNPVSDLLYYGGVLVLLAAVLITLVDLIQKYNILATRKLPQFDYRGGDDRA